MAIKKGYQTWRPFCLVCLFLPLFGIAQVVGCLNERKRLDYIQLQDLVEWLIQKHKPGNDFIARVGFGRTAAVFVL